MRKSWDPGRRATWTMGLALIAVLGVRAAWSRVALPVPVIGPVQLVPTPISNTVGTDRGCRTGGIGGINALNPEWVSVRAADTPAIAEGTVTKSFVSSEDAPNSHLSHDQNFDVAVDAGYVGLSSDANDVENGQHIMEMEWETKFFPPQFWPIPGDRVWMMGRWIFDCGHPPYKTEFHPPLAVAFTHLEPLTFAGDSTPSLTNRCSVFISGRGGYFDSAVAVRDYDFDIPLPPKPSNFATVHAEVVSLPFGGPTPVLTTGASGNTVHVHYPLAALNNPSPDLKFGAVIAAGWRNNVTAILGKPTLRVLRVTFDNIRINNDHDPDVLFVTNHGEYRLWVRAGSQWMEITGLGNVASGDTVAINKSVTLTVPDSGSVPVGLQTTGWEDDCDGAFGPTIRSPSVGDLQCLINGNDHIGVIAHDFTKAENFGIGSHDTASSQNGDGDTLDDYNLRYHIDQIALLNPPPVVAPGLTSPGAVSAP